MTIILFALCFTITCQGTKAWFTSVGKYSRSLLCWQFERSFFFSAGRTLKVPEVSECTQNYTQSKRRFTPKPQLRLFMQLPALLRKRPAFALLNQSALLKMSMAKRCMRYPKIGWISLSYILYLLTKASNATYFRNKPHIGGGNRASWLRSDTHIATVRAAPIADRFFFFKFQIKLACTYSKDNTARSLARPVFAGYAFCVVWACAGLPPICSHFTLIHPI